MFPRRRGFWTCSPAITGHIMMSNLYPAWTRRSNRTLSEWIIAYKKIIIDRNYQLKTVRNKSAILIHFDAEMGGRRLRNITPKMLQAFIASYEARGTHSAANTAYHVIGDLFREAWLDGWVAYSPALPLRSPRRVVKRARLSSDEWHTILSAAEGLSRHYLPHAMLLAIATAQRRGDIAKMRRTDIYDGHLHIHQQKTGYRLALPLTLRCPILNQTLGDVIERCPGGDYLLGDRRVNSFSLSIAFRVARNAAFPVDKWEFPPSFHEQRSLSERIYRDAGVDTQRLLGHRRREMTDKYNNNRGLDWNYLKL